MNLDQLKDLDFNNPGGWPWLAKSIALVLAVVLVVAGGWYFDWQDQLRRLDRVQAKEGQLKQQFALKQKRAANLDDYRTQLAEMRESFGAMLRQLPSRAEVSKLLVDISQTGLASGLEFELFKPQSSIRRDFYAELPVAIRVRGDFEEFARFISGVANLPRIVTLHDIRIATGERDRRGNGESADETLVMNLTAKTYWYLEEGEEDEQS